MVLQNGQIFYYFYIELRTPPMTFSIASVQKYKITSQAHRVSQNPNDRNKKFYDLVYSPYPMKIKKK